MMIISRLLKSCAMPPARSADRLDPLHLAEVLLALSQLAFGLGALHLGGDAARKQLQQGRGVFELIFERRVVAATMTPIGSCLGAGERDADAPAGLDRREMRVVAEQRPHAVFVAERGARRSDALGESRKRIGEVVRRASRAG